MLTHAGTSAERIDEQQLSGYMAYKTLSMLSDSLLFSEGLTLRELLGCESGEIPNASLQPYSRNSDPLGKCTGMSQCSPSPPSPHHTSPVLCLSKVFTDHSPAIQKPFTDWYQLACYKTLWQNVWGGTVNRKKHAKRKKDLNYERMRQHP